ncbi:hypothetical protein AGR13a_Cc170103 [Agrobacterium genomosp. 13 str. CFBP 6927]|uniref:Uncharacterized protein n=1 Tax=Agrobacterium genomosp. 13 str. CFBP 6927 TaxID=1183428 RepID=A0ABM9VBP7_9HYPH|nr:hypothetical protein AGR13a_Cc170103 [Agrobacterium genomosp. 13 str. CFBP 6927]
MRLPYAQSLRMVNTSLIHTGPAAVTTQIKAVIMVNTDGRSVDKRAARAKDSAAGRLPAGENTADFPLVPRQPSRAGQMPALLKRLSRKRRAPAF